ncbi:MAG TPA: CoA-transferase [Burkholderiales bacterium]|jgi:glutaconate CoA-transferase subunit A|nr:CoA-transferase [Burkholderiales bacterium]
MSAVGIAELAAMVPDGAKLVIAKDESGVAMAAALALIRRGVKNLHLVTVPVSGLETDMLIGAGCVATLETSAITLGEFGLAPCFSRAVKNGSIKLRDSTCPAIYAGLQAAQKGLPFMPLRGILETDVLANRPDWKVIDNPFEAGDRIVVLPAIVPDVALFHVPLADRHGNVFIGRQRELMLLAHAARSTLVTAEHITDENLLEDEARSGSVIPALYVSAVAHAPRGAWPLGFGDAYPADAAWLSRYADEARTQAGFARMLEAALHGPDARLAA